MARAPTGHFILPLSHHPPPPPKKANFTGTYIRNNTIFQGILKISVWKNCKILGENQKQGVSGNFFLQFFLVPLYYIILYFYYYLFIYSFHFHDIYINSN